MKILVTEKIDSEGLELLKKNFDVDQKLGLTPDQLREILQEYDALMVRSATKVTADMLVAGKNLKAIARAGVGVDNVDVQAATRQGVMVLNAPQGNTVSAAEMTITLLLAALRNVASSNASLRQSKWERSAFVGNELNGKTVGIIGLGPVGSHVARVLLGFGCSVLAYDPYVLEQKAKSIGVELVKGLDTLLNQSDVISVHTPLTPKTKDLISAEAFSKMKKGVVVVNTARGGIINEQALYNALASGHVRAAGLDVFSEEPPAPDSWAAKIIALPSVIATPHLGASTLEAQRNVSLIAAEQLALALQNKPVATAVNLPFVVDEAYSSQLQPFVQLAQNAGKMLFYLQNKPIARLDVVVQGESAIALSKAIAVAALKGFLEPTCDANFVNARYLAQEKSIQFNEMHSNDPADYTNMVTLHATDESGFIQTISFSLFSDRTPRLIRLNGFAFEAKMMSQLMLLVENDDVPGVVGAIGTALAEDGINIAELHLSRLEKGGRAMSLITIDEEPSPECVEKILQKPPIKSVKVLKL